MPTVRQNGTALRTFREMRGFSVSDLAQRAKVSPQALRNWELEHKALPVVKAERLCAVLRVSLEAITRDKADDEVITTAEVLAAS